MRRHREPPKVEVFWCGLEEWSAHIADENIETSLRKIGRLIMTAQNGKIAKYRHGANGTKSRPSMAQ
jgi:hypothetical protein